VYSESVAFDDCSGGIYGEYTDTASSAVFVDGQVVREKEGSDSEGRND